jgi:proliferating cell nuclear antigen
MRAITTSPDDIKAVVAMVSTVVEEAVFHCTSEGITFRGMDSSHVALIDISLPAEMFETYECPEEVQLGIRIADFSKLIKRAEKKDTLDLAIVDNQLVIRIGKKKYEMRLLADLGLEQKVPNIAYTTSFDIDVTKLDKLAGDVEVIADYMWIISKDGAVTFGGKGDSGNVEVEAELENLNSSEDGRSEYSLEYLRPAIKALGTTVGFANCHFSNNKPVKIIFKIGGVGSITYYLAPRIQP